MKRRKRQKQQKQNKEKKEEQLNLQRKDAWQLAVTGLIIPGVR